MTIKELNELSYLITEIKAMQCEIESMYNSYRSPAFEKIGSSPQRAGDPTSETVNKIAALQQQYNKMLNEMIDRRDMINSWIASLDNEEIKSIIRWHYLNQKSWTETAHIVYGNANERNAYRVLRRYFGKDK